MARPAPAATRATEILNFLIAQPGQPATLSEIARNLGMNLASAHAVLAVLSDAGYLVRHPTLRTYTIGPLLVAAGDAALEQHPAVDVARDEIRRLAEQHGVELVLTTSAGEDIVALARAGPRHPQGLEVGRRVPLIPPLGSVFVAWGTEEEVEAWLRRAGSLSVAERRRLRGQLETVRARGYSVNLRQYSPEALLGAIATLGTRPTAEARRILAEMIGELGHAEYQLERLRSKAVYAVGTIAAPVFDGQGRAVLALALADFPEPLSAKEIEVWATRLRDTGLVVTRRTRGTAPTPLDAPPVASAARSTRRRAPAG